MKLIKLMAQNQKKISDVWFNHFVDTYPIDTAPFFKNQGDPFSNPVGSTARQAIDGMLTELLGDMDTEVLTNLLLPLIRIRAVQAMFTASQAIGFIFLLKQIVRDQLKKELKANPSPEELFAVDRKIDSLALISFNIFTECREKIADLKANELKNRTFSAFERAGLVKD